jgi:hypothetical protein
MEGLNSVSTNDNILLSHVFSYITFTQFRCLKYSVCGGHVYQYLLSLNDFDGIRFFKFLYNVLE